MPTSEPAALGRAAAEAAARKYGLELQASSSGYHDAAFHSNGSKVQVKSASHSRADGPGVFRVWREHLESLDSVNGSVVLVVVSRDAPERPVLKVQKVSPQVLLDAGSFRPTGQKDMQGLHEARIPWPAVVSL